MAVKLMYDRQYILYNTSALAPREIVSVFILSISTQFYSRQSLSSFSSAVVCMTTDNRLDTLSNIHLAHRGIKKHFCETTHACVCLRIEKQNEFH